MRFIIAFMLVVALVATLVNVAESRRPYTESDIRYWRDSAQYARRDSESSGYTESDLRYWRDSAPTGVSPVKGFYDAAYNACVKKCAIPSSSGCKKSCGKYASCYAKCKTTKPPPKAPKTCENICA
jgi:hypothetical protein